MKFEILIKMLFELLAKKTVKTCDLAQKYCLSNRTIFRYVDTLCYAGVPIYTTRGRNGGVSIVDSFRLNSSFMTKEEFQQVIDTLSAITSSVPNKTLESAITKLKSTIRNEHSGFELKSGSLIIDAGPWGDTVGYKSKLLILQQAIDKTKQLKINYHDRNGNVTERIINPYIILFKQGVWYVYAYCNLREKFRFFKIGRIETAHVLDTSFIKQEVNSNQLPLDFWHTSSTPVLVELEVDKSVLSDVEEWLGVENVFNENGKFIAKASLPNDFGLVSKIMSFGNNVKVLYPTDLKKKIRDMANDIVNIYK